VQFNTAKPAPILDRIRFVVWKVGNISISPLYTAEVMLDRHETKLNLYSRFFDNITLNRNAISICRYETCGKHRFSRNVMLSFMRLVQRSNNIWHWNRR